MKYRWLYILCLFVPMLMMGCFTRTDMAELKDAHQPLSISADQPLQLTLQANAESSPRSMLAVRLTANRSSWAVMCLYDANHTTSLLLPEGQEAELVQIESRPKDVPVEVPSAETVGPHEIVAVAFLEKEDADAVLYALRHHEISCYTVKFHASDMVDETRVAVASSKLMVKPK